ncbi:MAG: CesT family type III secretion system chaperone [Nitrospirae bacterium]|nr:CesT family type III secretion system chaperone [Nitrospirota bacterium]
MTTRENVEDWLKELGNSIGVALTMDENGMCGFLYKNEVECIIEVPKESLEMYLYAPLVQLSIYDKETRYTLYEELLASNFLCLSTRGATLAIDKIKDEVLICFNQPLNSLADNLTFKNILGNFIETALSWKASLKSNAWQSEEMSTEGHHGAGMIV